MRCKETKRWTVNKINNSHLTYPQVREAAMWIRANEVVAFPTETVYGLGANAYSEAAVAKIFQAKGRPNDNPLIVHIANLEQLNKLVKEIPDHAQALMKAFWPGPLTIIFPKGEGIAENVTAGLSTVAVRMPDHPVALSLINEAKLPLAAPSANISGKPSPTTADHVYEDLNGKIIGIVDAGATGVGVESTVIDCTSAIPMILRPGGVTQEQLEKVIGPVLIDPALVEEGQAPKSPGIKYKHYAPKAKLILVAGSPTFLQNQVVLAREEGQKVGVLTTVENIAAYQAEVVLPCGSKHNLTTIAQQLYEVLRKFDQYDLDVIYSEIFSEEGIGKAIMNRLVKAAGGKVVVEET